MSGGHVHGPECEARPGAVLCVIPGPTKLLRRDDAVERWCFICRKRTEFHDEWWCDEEPSYYEPNWIRRCPRCGRDGSLFPGREWSYEDA